MKIISIMLSMMITIFTGCSSTKNTINWQNSTLIINKNLKIGDVIVTEGSNDWLSWFGHCGIVTEDFKIAEVPKLGTSVYYSDIGEWSEKDKRIIILRPKEIDNKFRFILVKNIEDSIGKPYSLKINKKDNDSFYCSQFIWYIYYNAGKEIGENIDIGDKGSIIVLPYDFIYSDYFIKVE